MGASYFAKVPAKKALSEYGLIEMTGAEKFWYVLMNVALGSGYLAKVITKKALSEVHRVEYAYGTPDTASESVEPAPSVSAPPGSSSSL
ncbi:hypothetical protein AN215_09805 [Streptomyces abyssalis]|uniref:Uncharacterized protein n=1 Tax=Streptomyces abyssalis TaxID=933944 RepID=A0A1E7JNV7_9ACTN|nr:hypothetical protein AN215_09805 [Streptomyces abyssalis]